MRRLGPAIGVQCKIFDKHPSPFHMRSPPPPGLFTVISNALQRESEIECYTARCILFFVDSAKSLSVPFSEEGNIKNIEKGVNDCSKI